MNKTNKLLIASSLIAAVVVPTVASAAENDTKGEHTASLRLEQGEFTLQTSASLSLSECYEVTHEGNWYWHFGSFIFCRNIRIKSFDGIGRW